MSLRRDVLVPGLALALVMVTTTARADGLYLKLRSPKGSVEAGMEFSLSIQAVATRSFALPSQPLLLVERDGKAYEATIRCPLAESERFVITPDRPREVACSLRLSEPGRYRMQLRFRLPDRVINSNRVSVLVTPDTRKGP